MSTLISQGLEVTAFGLGGVFAVLILFYLSTKIMLGIAKFTARRKARKAE